MSVPHTGSTGAGARWLAVGLSVLGALVAAWWILSGALTAVPSTTSSQSLSVDVDDVSALDVSSSAGSVRIEVADVDEARLDTTTSGTNVSAWTLEVVDDTLVVRSPDRWGWPSLGSVESDAVLTLPTELEGIDARLDLGAGELEAEGDWGDVTLEVAAGFANLSGSTASLAIDMAAGRVDADVLVDGDVDVDVSAGSLEAQIAGDMPALTVDVAAGDVAIGVPTGPYAVTVDASLGSPDIDVTERSDADRTIDVELAAGSLAIHEDR